MQPGGEDTADPLCIIIYYSGKEAKANVFFLIFFPVHRAFF